MDNSFVENSLVVAARRTLARRMTVVGCALCALGAVGASNALSAQAPAYDSSAFAALKWREIGPFRGGRSVAVAGSAARPNEYYMGTTGGGVFKTTDGGKTWVPVTDKYFGGTIGAIAVSESNPDIVYVGTGEYDIRGNVSHGDGVFKSTNAGKTWTAAGLADIAPDLARPHRSTRSQHRVRGRARPRLGADAARGVYKTTDGGAHWRQRPLPQRFHRRHRSRARSVQSRTCCTPRSGRRGARRGCSSPAAPAAASSSRPMRGEHWTEITRTPGLPHGIIGNIGIAVSPRQAEPRVGDRRSRLRRRVPLRRRRRDVDAHQRRAQAAPARVVLHAHLRRSQGHAIASTCSTSTRFGPTTAARRSTPPSSRPHGQSRPVDRAERSAADDRGQRRRRQRSRSTADAPGCRRTQPPRSSITSSRPTTFRTRCAARSRTPARCAGRAG